jgi:hypothetical protein
LNLNADLDVDVNDGSAGEDNLQPTSDARKGDEQDNSLLYIYI